MLSPKGVDELAATRVSAVSCSKSEAAKSRQSVGFIFWLRTSKGRLFRRLTGVLHCEEGDPILRLVPAKGDRSSMLCMLIFGGDIAGKGMEGVVPASCRTTSLFSRGDTTDAVAWGGLEISLRILLALA